MADRPFISIDPVMRSGRPTLNHTRLPVESVVDLVEHHGYGGVESAMEAFVITRPEVLMCCWYVAKYGPAKFKRAWGAWARDVFEELYQQRYDIPDPFGATP